MVAGTPRKVSQGSILSHPYLTVRNASINQIKNKKYATYNQRASCVCFPRFWIQIVLIAVSCDIAWTATSVLGNIEALVWATSMSIHLSQNTAFSKSFGTGWFVNRPTKSCSISPLVRWGRNSCTPNHKSLIQISTTLVSKSPFGEVTFGDALCCRECPQLIFAIRESMT